MKLVDLHEIGEVQNLAATACANKIMEISGASPRFCKRRLNSFRLFDKERNNDCRYKPKMKRKI